MPSLHWLGKSVSELACQRTPIFALEPRDPTKPGLLLDDNTLIQGDNLRALRALLPFYKGKIRFVYADPPYNTGNQLWIYNDAMNAEETRAWIDKTVGPEDLSRSDKWLCMMQPRLEAIYDLLADDGVFVCSIDDAELQNLLALLDAQFGKENRVGIIVWRNKTSGNEAAYMATQHEYLVVYAKNLEALKESDPQWRVPKPHVEEVLSRAEELMVNKALDNEQKSVEMKKWFKEQEKSLEQALTSSGMSVKEAKAQAVKEYKALSMYNRFDKKGLHRSDNLSWPGGGGPTYDILHPKTKKPCKVPSGGWQFTEDTMKQKLSEDRIIFGSDETNVPQQKKYLLEITSSVMKSVVDDIRGASGTGELREILQGDLFAYPKPTDLIKRIIALVTNPGDLILDPFAGSGTTAHAVLKLNAENPAEEPRRFIAIEMEKEVEEKVTSVRLDRVIKGYKTPKGKKVKGLGGSYSRWTIGDEVRHADGSLGEGASHLALSQILASYYNLPLQKPSKGKPPLVGESESTVLFFYHGGAGDTFGTDELQSVEKLADGRRAIVYAHNSFVDNNRAAERGVEIKIIPYDFPVQPIN